MVVNDADSVLCCEKISKEFGVGQERNMALQELSFSLQRGEILGLVGPDGAGKTTLLRLIAGLLLPTSGSIELLGRKLTRENLDQQQIGYMPQQFGLYQDLTVQENLNFYADLQKLPYRERHDRFARLLEMTDLAPFTGAGRGSCPVA